MSASNLLISLAMLVLAAIACVALRLVFRRRHGARRRRPALKLKHPVVLAHGLMGFDKITLGGHEREYFRGVRAKLEAMGAQVHVVRVSAFASVEQRARELTAAINAIGAKRVNVIAHSMGGLDARFAISRLNLAPRVASLITIGTPHRGTPLADLATSLLGDALGLKRMLAAFGLDVDAFYALTTHRMLSFNLDVPDAKHVFYGCMLARATPRLGSPLGPGHLFLTKKAGDNDGLVPADSQRWGEVIAEIDADHWAQIGWADGSDAPALYARAVDELKARGL
jgi:triacylglycerol lipase